MTEQELIDFETDIYNEFEQGHIRFPIHLSKNNECHLIEIFKQIKPTDWVFASHRNHYSALLHGIPKDWLKEQILRGNSMHIMSQEYKFFSSSIVAGSLPIAVGMAASLKGTQDKVWAFLGDMASLSGAFFECVQYSQGFNLPISFVIECNGMATNTPSYETVNINHVHNTSVRRIKKWDKGEVLMYCYERQLPHINIGKFVSFH